jgi:hypothetical protein
MYTAGIAVSKMQRRSVQIGFSGFLLAVLAWAAHETSPDQSRVIEAMLHAEAARFENVEGYTRLQHYSASDERFGLQAEMLARIHYDKSTGKTFEIISRSGSPLIQSRVFEALLQEEVDVSKVMAHEGGLLSSHNYSLRLTGQREFAGRQCYLLELTPLRHDKHLIQGHAWVDMEDYGVVHVEGRPADSVSFWIGKPVVIQDFDKISGYWFATRRHSFMNGFLTGQSELTVDYSDYQIHLKPSATAH